MNCSPASEVSFETSVDYRRALWSLSIVRLVQRSGRRLQDQPILMPVELNYSVYVLMGSRVTYSQTMWRSMKFAWWLVNVRPGFAGSRDTTGLSRGVSCVQL